MERRMAYPIVISPCEDGYYVEIPDFNSGTQGDSVADAMEMARDAIGLMGIDMEDEGNELPKPYSQKMQTGKDDILTLVDVDFDEYRRKVDNKSVKKNCTIPYWMSVKADKIGVKYSRILQEAILNILETQKG